MFWDIFQRVLLPMFLILALALFGCNYLTKASCEATAAELGLPWKYSLMTGCIVTLKDGTKIPLDKYRAVE